MSIDFQEIILNLLNIQFFVITLACGGRYNQSTGVIATPNYPNTYPLQVSCGWSITVEEGKQVNLTFETFSLPQARIRFNNWRDCDTYIDIYDRAHPDDAYRITGM